jgi:hypothetical protein
MIEIEINHNDEVKKYNFPTSWDDVTIDKYQKLFELKTPDQVNDLYLFDLIEVLSEIKKEILFQMSIEDFKKLTSQLDFVSNSVENNTNDFVELDGEQYFLHTDFNTYTAGEIITIDTILKKYEYNYNACLTDLLVVFLRKKINNKIEPFTLELFQRKESFNKLKITDVNKVFGFFLLGKNILGDNTADSLEKNDQKEM